MLKTLGAQVKQYRWVTFITPVFSALEAVADMFLPMLMSQIIDKGVKVGGQAGMQAVLHYGAIMVAVAIGALVCGILAGRFASIASTGFAANLRQAMFANIQSFSFSNIDRFSTAGLVTRLTTDVSNVQLSYQMITRICVRAPVMLITALIMAFSIHASLSMIFVAAIVILAATLSFIIFKATGTFNRVFKKYDDLNASVQENVGAIRVVKAFVREDYERSKFNKAANAVYRMFVKAETYVSFNNPVMMLTVFGSMLGLSWLGAKAIVLEGFTEGGLMSLFSYVMSILMSLMMISMIFVMMSMSVASARRICEVLNEKADLTSPAQALTAVPDGSVDFDHVSFSYRQGKGKPVLQDIDLQVRSGEVMGLVGESGCGKSTLARLALGLIEPTEGTVRFKNAPIPERDSAAWRAQRASMQMIHQDPYACFDPHLPIIEQVAEPLRHHRGLSKEAAAKAALEVLRAAGLPAHHAGRRPSVMSGGQLQRAAIARAVALEPALLVCDEPVASLDVSIQAQVLELLLQLRNRMKMAMLFVSHNLSVVRCICDRVTVMYLGRIVESGTVEAVFSRPLHPYTKLLMASTPGADAHVVRYYPKGAMPSPIDRPKGCVFASRCPLAEARCRTDVPPLRDDGSGHLAACFSGPSFLLHPEA